MTAAIYSLTAIASAVFATRAWLLDRHAPERIAFLGLGWALAVTHLAFAASLLTPSAALRGAMIVAACAIPGFAWRALYGLFHHDEEDPPPELGDWLTVAGGVVGPACALTYALLQQDDPKASAPEVVAGLFVFGGLGFLFRRMWRARQAAGLRVERERLTWVLVVSVAAVVFSLVEWVVRYTQQLDPDVLDLVDRSVALHGAVPPIGAVLAATAIYLHSHALLAYRLISLHEMVSRMAVVGLAAAALVATSTLTVRWAAMTGFPLHAGYLLLLVFGMYLVAYDAVRPGMQETADHLFNRQGMHLDDASKVLLAELPALLSTEAVADRMVAVLHQSGRIRNAATYVWSPSLQAFRRQSAAGLFEGTPLEAVAADPFTHGFVAGRRYYVSPGPLRPRLPDYDVGPEILTLMEAMEADLVVPFQVGEVVFGWLTLRDAAWSDGFSEEERGRLVSVGESSGRSLANIDDFRKMTEAHRLAALGTMSAGLAHEIRNPLAGLKGAAQVLRMSNAGHDDEMLEVIVAEVDRLDGVVSRFLDYARPLDLDRQPISLDAIAAHAAHLIGAEDGDVSLEVALSGDLPDLLADDRWLSHVVLNLLRNAVESVDRAGTVRLTTREGHDEHGKPVQELIVEDDGPGVPEELRASIFTPFVTTKKRTGTGLGLAISQRIVRAHDGRIEVTGSQLGGARFAVRLPLVVAPEPTQA